MIISPPGKRAGWSGVSIHAQNPIPPPPFSQVTFTGPGTLGVDQVSLFPTENVRRGRGYMNPWPFRQDLLNALKGLHPRQETGQLCGGAGWLVALQQGPRYPGHVGTLGPDSLTSGSTC